MRGTKRQTLITEPKPDGETQTSYGYGGTLIDDPKSTPPHKILQTCQPNGSLKSGATKNGTPQKTTEGKYYNQQSLLGDGQLRRQYAEAEYIFEWWLTQ